MSTIALLDPLGEIGAAVALGLEHDGHRIDAYTNVRGPIAVPDYELVIATVAAVKDPPLRRIRERSAALLLIGAGVIDASAVAPFHLGRDEYLPRPFGIAELYGRVDQMLRRAGGEPPAARHTPELLHFDATTVDLWAGLVRRGSQVHHLRRREVDLLRALLRRSGGVATRRELMAEAWGRRPSRDGSRAVDNCILALRHKLEPQPAAPRYLLTVHGAGYRLVPPGRPADDAPFRPDDDHDR